MTFLIALIIFSILYCLTSFKVIKLRRQGKVSIGRGKESERLSHYISAQRNLFEYSTIFLFQLFALENFAVNNYFLLSLLAVFIIARILHFLSLTRVEPKATKENKHPNFRLRVLGMQLTFLVIICASLMIASFFVI